MELYSADFLEKIDQQFSFIQLIPIAVSIIDVESKCFVKYNDKFLKTFDLDGERAILPISNIVLNNLENGINESANDEFLWWFKVSSDKAILTRSSSKLFEIQHRKLFLCTHYHIYSKDMASLDVNDDENIDPNYTNSLVFISEIFDRLPIYTFVISEDTDEIIYINNIVKEKLGCNKKEDCKKKCGDLLKGFCTKACLPEKMGENEEYKLDNLWLKSYSGATYWINGHRAKLVTFLDITQTKMDEEALLKQASFDEMTGIYNRSMGMKFLNVNYEKVKRGNGLFTISYLDMNGLKFVNDTFGHNEGDIYINSVVDAIESSIRKTDIFARLGGDEFVLIFLNCNYYNAAKVMKNIMNKLAQLTKNNNEKYDMSISYGLHEVNTDTKLSMEEILKSVDANMYYMKNEYKRLKALKNKANE